MKNASENKISVCFVLPSLGSGGMERVMSELVWFLSKYERYSITLLIMTKASKFYSLPGSVRIIEPDFDHRRYSRLKFTSLIFLFVRKVLKKHKPQVVLSFGGKYNSFVILANLGLKSKIFVSDRSRPGVKYGILQSILNPIVYRYATGIIAQTKLAKEYVKRQTNHQNITIIGNPIRIISSDQQVAKNNIILNVGRFISTKNQSFLIEYFEKISDTGWELVFIGDGPKIDLVKKQASESKVSDRIKFLGNIRNIDDYYRAAKIFAFTSTSEGFPNSLAEAMSAGLACISFDCMAGPSDLIDDGVNGFLIPELDHNTYISRLSRLMNDQNLIKSLGDAAIIKMKKYHPDVIGDEYLRTLELI
ncbi:glycosyltransferase family 4 protein [Flavihumibacter cheonanensis]|uniref:glycosyltransferase n=1 Tax=Flavihumibacter cheonanensis TaxID=1442385 RepID=UPI001EF7CE25|nr:glycosyltransferase [Flavihumibacter cheonanensis]MCG7753880.1 glycosyltransferase [Flavihumibacter cheonanensis]